VLYYLLVLWGVSAGFMLAGILPYSAVALAFSSALILAICLLVNTAFAWAFGAKSSLESILITGLILALIITPMAPGNFAETGFAVFASAWGVASKYIFAIGRRHIFNPAAFGAAIAAIALGSSVSWWIGGSLYLLPLVILGGLLIMRKLPCLEMIVAFSLAACATVALTASRDRIGAVTQMVLHSMFFFFAFVMLTEPRTAPQGRSRRILYAAIIGVLFAPEIHLGAYYTTPEIALVIGNAFAFLSSTPRLFRRRAIGAMA
jgi:Na+-transporting NADH:ubiquinone oxidoreductase subunit NqrB